MKQWRNDSQPGRPGVGIRLSKGSKRAQGAGGTGWRWQRTPFHKADANARWTALNFNLFTHLATALNAPAALDKRSGGLEGRHEGTGRLLGPCRALAAWGMAIGRPGAGVRAA